MSKNIDKLVDMMYQIMNGEDDTTVLDHDTDQETTGNTEVSPGGYIEGGAAGGKFACAVIQNVGKLIKERIR